MQDVSQLGEYGILFFHLFLSHKHRRQQFRSDLQNKSHNLFSYLPSMLMYSTILYLNNTFNKCLLLARGPSFSFGPLGEKFWAASPDLPLFKIW